MKKNSAFQSILISAICVSLAGTTLLGIPGANAELAVPTAGSSSAPAAVEDQYCDSLCPSIVGSNGQSLSVTGASSWGAADDQWCANHNSQTSPSVMATPAPLGATVPTGACSVSYYPGDTSCAQITAGFNQCQYRNSQVESYCGAYESAKMAGAGEDLVLILDIAATGTCAAACIAKGMSSAVDKVCRIGAIGAGLLDLITALTQKDSVVGKMIESAAAGAVGYEMYSTISLANQLNGGTTFTKGFSAKDVNPNLDADDQKKERNEACLTAAAMAALTGLRYYNMGYGQRTKAKACTSIWGLQSSATAIAGGISAAGYTASGGSAGTTTSGSSVGSSGTSAGTSAATGLNCMAGGGTVASCAGQSSAATDGGILSGGLGNAALPLAQQLANAGLPAALQSGGGLGSAMGGAMSGDGAFGNALTKIAEKVAADGKELGNVASMGGYGGGGGGGATASDSNGMANLFANAGGPTAAAAPMQVFKGDGEDSDDIWHSHSSSNIFQIVSHRIGKANP